MMKYDLGKNEFKNWIVSEIKFEEKYIGKTEAIFALGNGYIGLRSANEERYLNEKRDLFISGTFNKANKNEVTELPNVADVTEIEIFINGKHLMLNASNNKEYVKYLNLKTLLKTTKKCMKRLLIVNLCILSESMSLKSY